jgi:DNA-3-methyladenine glycosylase
VVCGGVGVASAVLLRGAAPLAGLELMRARRGPRRDRELCAGPARLTQAFGLTGADDGADLVRGDLRILDDGTRPPRRPKRSIRVGLAAGRGDAHPWRWFVDGDINVSRASPTRASSR